MPRELQRWTKPRDPLASPKPKEDCPLHQPCRRRAPEGAPRKGTLSRKAPERGRTQGVATPAGTTRISWMRRLWRVLVDLIVGPPARHNPDLVDAAVVAARPGPSKCEGGAGTTRISWMRRLWPCATRHPEAVPAASAQPGSRGCGGCGAPVVALPPRRLPGATRISWMRRLWRCPAGGGARWRAWAQPGSRGCGGCGHPDRGGTEEGMRAAQPGSRGCGGCGDARLLDVPLFRGHNPDLVDAAVVVRRRRRRRWPRPRGTTRISWMRRLWRRAPGHRVRGGRRHNPDLVDAAVVACCRRGRTGSSSGHNPDLVDAAVVAFARTS